MRNLGSWATIPCGRVVIAMLFLVTAWIPPSIGAKPVLESKATSSQPEVSATEKANKPAPETSQAQKSRKETDLFIAENNTLLLETAPEIRVTNSQELVNALKNAVGGETIILATGNYGDLDFSGRAYSSYVTLRSEDAENRAVFQKVDVRRVSYLRFESIVVHHEWRDGDTTDTCAFRAKDSNHIELLNSELYGSTDGINTNDVKGFGTTNSTYVLFEANTVHDFYYGSKIYFSDNITMRHNTFRDIRCDGIAAESTSHITIENNTFTSFHPWMPTGDPTIDDHPDFIQIYNGYGTKNMTDVVIRGNTMLRGTGGWAQSIFIESKSKDGLYRGENFIIEYNTIYNGNMQGITIYDVAGVTVQHNTVLADWTATMSAYKTVPRLQLLGTSAAVVRYNILTYYKHENDIGTVFEDNVMVDFTDATHNNYADLFQGAGDFGPSANILDFIPLAGSILIRDGPDIGALDYQPPPPPAIPAAVQNLADGLASLLGTASFNPFTVTVAALGTQPATYQLSFKSLNEFDNTAEAGMITGMTVTLDSTLSILGIDANYYGYGVGGYIPLPDNLLLYASVAYVLGGNATVEQVLAAMSQAAWTPWVEANVTIAFHLGETIYDNGPLYQFFETPADDGSSNNAL